MLQILDQWWHFHNTYVWWQTLIRKAFSPHAENFNDISRKYPTRTKALYASSNDRTSSVLQYEDYTIRPNTRTAHVLMCKELPFNIIMMYANYFRLLTIETWIWYGLSMIAVILR